MKVSQLQMKLHRQQKKGKASFLQKYKSFCFKILGRYFERKTEQYNNLRDRLIQADLRMTPGVYYSTMIITTLIICIISLISSLLVFMFLMNISNWYLYCLGLTGIIILATYLFFPFILNNKISNRRSSIEQEIPFILSELSILATTGMTPIQIFRNMGKRHIGTPIHREFNKIIYKLDIDGKDIISSLSETAKETASPTLREILWDLANMIHQGGELDVYLRNKADTTMQIKRDIQKQFIDKISVYLEVYISLFLISIILMAIAIFLLDILGQNIGGITPETLLLLTSFGLVPLITMVIDILVSMVYSKNG